MILVDTSVWIDFLRSGNERLKDLLEQTDVVTHPLIKGELHVGNIKKRSLFLSLLDDLPMVAEASHEEVLYMIERHRMFGKGIGYLDTHILCSAIISNTPMWTLDKRLTALAKKFKISA